MRFHQLEPWEELFGTFEDIQVDASKVSVIIAGILLRYPHKSPEGEFLISHLVPEMVGSKVGILNAEKDLRVRWPDEVKKSKKPSKFLQWYFETYGILEAW